MNKLNETTSTKTRILSDSDLTKVVGGWGHGHHGNSNMSKRGRQGNGRSNNQPTRIVVIFNTFNTTTIINNNNGA